MSSPDTASSTVLKPLIPMEYRYLGRSGLRVSAISFGAWVTWGASISDDEAFACMKAAYELGCNFFDNAEVTSLIIPKYSFFVVLTIPFSLSAFRA